MKRAIITPTFSGHFNFIQKYLESFDKYLIDKDFPLCFIINKNEEKEFILLTKQYKNLNIKIYFLDDILKQYNILESAEEILSKYGRLSFQTIKKIYGALYISAEQFVFLDSESLMIKPTNLNKLFDDFYKKPKFFISDINNRNANYRNSFTYEFIRNITCLIDKNPEYYTTESYEWFYELEILKDSIKVFGNPMDVIRNYKLPNKHMNVEGILEALWYYQYILYNNRYGYNIFITDEVLRKYLKNNYESFKKDFDNSDFWNVGILEVITKFINKNNYKAIIELYQNYDISITRMEMPLKYSNFKYQKKFLEQTNIHILASNQEHLFLENNFKIFLKNSKSLNYLKKNLSFLINPIKNIIKFCFSIFNCIFYFVKFILEFLFFYLG